VAPKATDEGTDSSCRGTDRPNLQIPFFGKLHAQEKPKMENSPSLDSGRGIFSRQNGYDIYNNVVK
jgi:hypothetical protein